MVREKKSLPLTHRGSGVKQLAPGVDAIENAMELARFNSETADYLVGSFKKSMFNLGKSMIERSKGMLKKLENFRDFVFLQNDSKGGAWAGKPVKTDFKNFQQNVADKAAEEFTTAVTNPVKIDFAVSNESEFIRGFSADGKKLSKDSAKPLDTLLKAFLAENDLVDKKSVLYQANDKGVINQIDGVPQKADPQDARDTIEDGLPDYLDDRGITVTVKSHTHPADRAGVQKGAQKDAEPAPTPEDEGPSAAPAA
ncbi:MULTISPECIES: hypothetical protein [Legionella]|uniref:Substrate of the Dot/Icm secretion system n=1 Tax=Legionella drozanskii LLAP-1 TaxID=1212489 RepID=A0A0W0SQM3_9GAMM|nr:MULTISPECIES: hypothetical protein [Legionella]KTC85497.1 substrate of the Dot/Icm secretion system [Legionella drozanskii LLAP-1]PJE18158.1 MAG: hypothetical protein CK430_00715 [Legionella sp.]